MSTFEIKRPALVARILSHQISFYLRREEGVLFLKLRYFNIQICHWILKNQIFLVQLVILVSDGMHNGGFLDLQIF